MTLAVEDYIYYTQFHLMRDEKGNINNLVSRMASKNQIMANAIQKHQMRISQQSSKFMNSDEAKQIEDILSGDKWIQDIQDSVLPNNNSRNASEAQYGDLVSMAMALKQDISDKSTSAEKFKNALNAFINEVEKSYTSFAAKYSKNVMNHFINSARYGSRSARQMAKEIMPGASAEKSASLRILETLASEYSGTAFRVVDNIDNSDAQNKISVALGKMIVLRDALGESGNYVDSLSSKEQHAFYQRVYAAMGKWINDFIALVEEIAVVEGAKKAAKKIDEAFDGINNAIRMQSVSSTHRFSYSDVANGNAITVVQEKIKTDPRWKRDLEKLESMSGVSGKATKMQYASNNAKADAYFILNGDSGVTGDIGVSVKKNEDINFSTGKGLSKVGIKIQSNTPLLTLMTREADMSYNDVLTYMNIGGALPADPSLRGYNGGKHSQYDTSLAASWETIKEGIKYKSFYNALTGYGENANNVFFMSVDGRLFSVMSLLQHFQKTMSIGSGIDWTVSGNGLDRGQYQEINKNAFVEGPRSKKYAYGGQRSENVRMEYFKLLQNTKVNIAMNIAQLSALVK